jgi:hypothetical protein
MARKNDAEYDRDAYHYRKDVWIARGQWYCRSKRGGVVLGPFSRREDARSARRNR